MQQAAPRLEPGDRDPEPQPRQQQAPYAPQQQSPGPVVRPAAQGGQQGAPGQEPGDPNPERRAAAEWQQQQLLHMGQALQRRQAMGQALAEGRDPGGRVSPALRAGAGLLGGGLWGGPPRGQHAAQAPPGFAMAPVLEGAQAASLQQQAAALAAGYAAGRLAPAEVRRAPSWVEDCMPAILHAWRWCCFLRFRTIRRCIYAVFHTSRMRRPSMQSPAAECVLRPGRHCQGMFGAAVGRRLAMSSWRRSWPSWQSDSGCAVRRLHLLHPGGACRCRAHPGHSPV